MTDRRPDELDPMLALEATDEETVAAADGPPTNPDTGATDAEVAATALDLGLTDRREIPPVLRNRLIEQGERMAAFPVDAPHRFAAGKKGTPTQWALAAALALAVGVAAVLGGLLRQRQAALRTEEQRVATLVMQIEENERLLERSQTRLADARQTISDQEIQNQRLARRLADATSDIDRLEVEIARYQEPRDPAELAESREKLLEVPGTVRLAWQPFELPNLPPVEQGDVRGDVVWNDALQTGYLRFVGLEPNDPRVEQYQVWVIDERGMEQKVSGGVFNATADGEVIVPIDPSIDVENVALFAVTVEDPGGVAVPDLSRRVVVAPNEDEES